MTENKPWCVVCSKRVDEMIHYSHPSQPYMTVFKVRCHGEVERTGITDKEMHMYKISAGLAFRNRVLGQGGFPELPLKP